MVGVSILRSSAKISSVNSDITGVSPSLRIGPILLAPSRKFQSSIAPAKYPPTERASLFDDLPERILLDHLVAAEAVEVAAARLDALAVLHGAGDGPLRDAHVAVDVVGVLAIVHVGQAFETRLEAFAHRGTPDISPAQRIGATRHLEHAVICEEGHDGIEIMRVERPGQGLERVEPPNLLVHD